MNVNYSATGTECGLSTIGCNIYHTRSGLECNRYLSRGDSRQRAVSGIYYIIICSAGGEICHTPRSLSAERTMVVAINIDIFYRLVTFDVYIVEIEIAKRSAAYIFKLHGISPCGNVGQCDTLSALGLDKGTFGNNNPLVGHTDRDCDIVGIVDLGAQNPELYECDRTVEVGRYEGLSALLESERGYLIATECGVGRIFRGKRVVQPSAMVLPVKSQSATSVSGDV